MGKPTSTQLSRIKKLQQQLKTWRQEQNILRKKIEKARAELRSLGEDPDPKFDLSPRNQEIYRLVKKGKTMAEVGEIFGLGKERVRLICKRQERKISYGNIRAAVR